MAATTIKIEDPLLTKLNSFITSQRSLSAFVREILEREVQKRKTVKAASQYASFLKKNQEEQNWLKDWENADLGNPPKIFKKRKKK